MSKLKAVFQSNGFAYTSTIIGIFLVFLVTGCVPSRYPDIPVKEAFQKYSYEQLVKDEELMDSIVDDPSLEFKLSTDRKVRRDQILTFAKMSDGLKKMDEEQAMRDAWEAGTKMKEDQRAQMEASQVQPQPTVEAIEAPMPVAEPSIVEVRAAPAPKKAGIVTGNAMQGTPLDNSPIHDFVQKSQDKTYFEYVNLGTSSMEYYVSAKGNKPTYIADCEMSQELMGNGLIHLAGLSVEPSTPEICAGGRVEILRGVHYKSSKNVVEIRLDGKLIYANTYFTKSM